MSRAQETTSRKNKIKIRRVYFSLEQECGEEKRRNLDIWKKKFTRLKFALRFLLSLRSCVEWNHNRQFFQELFIEWKEKKCFQVSHGKFSNFPLACNVSNWRLTCWLTILFSQRCFLLLVILFFCFFFIIKSSMISSFSLLLSTPTHPTALLLSHTPRRIKRYFYAISSSTIEKLVWNWTLMIRHARSIMFVSNFVLLTNRFYGWLIDKRYQGKAQCQYPLLVVNYDDRTWKFKFSNVCGSWEIKRTPKCKILHSCDF